MFVGGGYREGGVTFGARLNLVFDNNKDIYGSAFMPFVRVIFSSGSETKLSSIHVLKSGRKLVPKVQLNQYHLIALPFLREHQ